MLFQTKRIMTKLFILSAAFVLMGAVAVAQQTESKLKVGDKAPAFTGVDINGKKMELQSLLAKGPVVVVFYRGQWCPFCNKYVKALQDSIAVMEKKGATLVAVTPESPENAKKMVEKNGLSYAVISDNQHAIMDAFGVSFAPSDQAIQKMKGWGLDLAAANAAGNGAILPVPATYVIGKDGTIKFVHYNPDYKQRAPIGALNKVL